MYNCKRLFFQSCLKSQILCNQTISYENSSAFYFLTLSLIRFKRCYAFTHIHSYKHCLLGSENNDGNRRRWHVFGRVDKSVFGCARPIPVNVARTRSGGVFAGVHSEFTVQVGRRLVRGHRSIYSLFARSIRQPGTRCNHILGEYILVLRLA